MQFDLDKITPCGGICLGCQHFMNNECKGCLTTGGKCVKMWENGCVIYDCCQKHNAKFCGLCGEFPCKDFFRITEWGDKDALRHHREAAEKYRERTNGTMNVYESCPKYENDVFLIRRTEKSDRDDLLKVYSDIKAVPFFNGDNCHGDDFHYTTPERMEQALDFWEESYRGGWFVRFSVIDKASNAAVGTAELFKRGVSEDFYSGYGILRLDLRSDYEKERVILNILSLIIPPAYGLFGCESIATKAVKEAVERISALEKYGFEKNDNKLIGEDGTEYSDYFSISQAVNGERT